MLEGSNSSENEQWKGVALTTIFEVSIQLMSLLISAIKTAVPCHIYIFFRRKNHSCFGVFLLLCSDVVSVFRLFRTSLCVYIVP